MKSPVFVSDAMTPRNRTRLSQAKTARSTSPARRPQPYVAAARADGTRRLYARAGALGDWCAAMHASPLPAAPETIAAYLAELARAGKSVATIKGALAAILYVHREQGHRIDAAAPAIATVMAGITRKSSRPIRRAAALELGSLRAIIADIEGDDVRAPARPRAAARRLLWRAAGAPSSSPSTSKDAPLSRSAPRASSCI